MPMFTSLTRIRRYLAQGTSCVLLKFAGNKVTSTDGQRQGDIREAGRQLVDRPLMISFII